MAGIMRTIDKYTLIYMLVHFTLSAASFEYSAFCERQCGLGRGGNLCKCSAVHFAGKRTLSETILNDLENTKLSDPKDSFVNALVSTLLYRLEEENQVNKVVVLL